MEEEQPVVKLYNLGPLGHLMAVTPSAEQEGKRIPIVFSTLQQFPYLLYLSPC